MSDTYFLAMFLWVSIFFHVPIMKSGDQEMDQAPAQEVTQNDTASDQTAQDTLAEELWSTDQIGVQEPEQFQMESDVQEITEPEVSHEEPIINQGTTEVIVSDFEKPEELEDEVQDVQGLHTVGKNDPEGNWLFKRIWWEKSKNIYGKMRDRVDKIVESRMHFFKERVKLDSQYTDPFYANIGFDQGVLTEMVNHLLELIKIDRAQVAALSAKELEQYNMLMEEKNKLAALQAAVSDVKQLDDALDDALQNLMQQVNLARSYERQAWQLLEAIAEELSDKKAREHYYVVATLWRNVKNIGNYIIGPFSQHFFEVGTKVVQQIKAVEDLIAELKIKGVEFNKQVEAENKTCSVQEDQDPEEQEEPVQKTEWFAAIGWKMIALLFLTLLGIGLIVYRRIIKK